MKKMKSKNLTLSRETLRHLDTLSAIDTDEMKKVKGGLAPIFTDFSDCYPCW